MGSPIRASCISADGLQPISAQRWITACRYRPLLATPCAHPLRPMDARGVGQYEQSLSCMWRTNGTCGQHAPLRMEPE